ncbi:MAG: tricarboxylate transporter [Rhizobiales bacterium]|nr:tricarboxylate transporter [Hyphomicrobiales bacterium]
MRQVFNLVSVLAIGLVALGVVKAKAADFSGKTIEWVIPFKAGGGTDRWARFYAPMLSEELPGNPKIVIKNIPGEASIKGANWFASWAIPNGLTILGTSGSTQFPYLLGDKRVRFDYADWNVVLATATGGVAYLPPDLASRWKKDPHEVIANVKFVFASQGPKRLDLVPLLAWEMLGMKVEALCCIEGRGSGRQMFERGDVNIDYQTSSAFLSKALPLVKSGKAVPIMTWGTLDETGDVVRDPTFPDILTFKEIYTWVKDETPSGDDWEVWKAFFVAGFSAQKMVFLPKGTSTDIIDAYTAAFEAVTKRADFAVTSKAQLGVYPQSVGDAAKEKLALGIGVNDKAKSWIKRWLQERYGVKP